MSYRSVATIFGGAALFAAFASAHAAPPRMEHNAFLRKPVFSRAQLVASLNDPVVAKRYRAHFGRDRKNLERYFATLRLTPLKKGGRYLAYNVDPKTYKVGRRLLYFPKGTLVYADAAGKPILKRSCGNPMTAFAPAMPDTVKFRPRPEEPVVEVTPPPPAVNPVNPDDVTPAAPPVEVVTQPEVIAPVAPVAPVTPVAPPLVVAGLGSVGNIVTGLLVTGALVGGGFSLPQDNYNPPPPVPEPASMLVLGAGLAALARRRRR